MPAATSTTTYVALAGGVVGQAGSQMRGQQGPSEGDHTGTIFRTLHHTNATVAGDSCVGVDVGAARIEGFFFFSFWQCNT